MKAIHNRPVFAVITMFLLIALVTLAFKDNVYNLEASDNSSQSCTNTSNVEDFAKNNPPSVWRARGESQIYSRGGLYVVDIAGKAISGAAVYAGNDYLKLDKIGKVDGDGYLDYSITKYEYFAASVIGFYGCVQKTVTNTDRQVVYLSRMAKLHVTVENAEWVNFENVPIHVQRSAEGFRRAEIFETVASLKGSVGPVFVGEQNDSYLESSLSVSTTNEGSANIGWIYPFDTHTVSISDPRFSVISDTDVELLPGEERGVVIPIGDGPWIRGQLTRSDNTPYVDAKIVLFRANRGSGSTTVYQGVGLGYSRAGGGFVIGPRVYNSLGMKNNYGLLGQLYLVVSPTVDVEGHPETLTTTIVVAKGINDLGVLRTRPMDQVSGIVIDEDTKTPIVGAELTVTVNSSGAPGFAGNNTTITDEYGRFILYVPTLPALEDNANRDASRTLYISNKTNNSYGGKTLNIDKLLESHGSSSGITLEIRQQKTEQIVFFDQHPPDKSSGMTYTLYCQQYYYLKAGNEETGYWKASNHPWNGSRGETVKLEDSKIRCWAVNGNWISEVAEFKLGDYYGWPVRFDFVPQWIRGGQVKISKSKGSDRNYYITIVDVKGVGVIGRGLSLESKQEAAKFVVQPNVQLFIEIENYKSGKFYRKEIALGHGEVLELKLDELDFSED